MIIKIAQLLLSLTILVALHELGHFVAAKMFKTRVEKFYIFFNPWFSLFKKKIGETTYGIGWLPLGGYVKISGMIDESMDKEQLEKDPEPWEFRSKPRWQKLIIMLGGVFVNVVLAFFIYSMVLWFWGKGAVVYNSDINDNYGIDVIYAGCLDKNSFNYNQYANYPADCVPNENSGSDLPDFIDFSLKPGDKIIEIDGKNYDQVDWRDVRIDLILWGEKELLIERNNKTIPINFSGGDIKLIVSGMVEIMPRVPVVVGRVLDKDYTVQQGDNLDSVAIKNYISIDDLLLKNNIKGDLVVGQKIKTHEESAIIARKAGLKEGMRIVSCNGEDIFSMVDLKYFFNKYKGDRVTLGIEKNKNITLTIPNEVNPKIGFLAKDYYNILPSKDINYSLLGGKNPSCISAGVFETSKSIRQYVGQLPLIFLPETGVYKEVGGFIKIGQIFPEDFSWKKFWILTALLSIMLAVINLLPIPALDGGHAAILIFEMITGRDVNPKILEKLQIVGMIILLGLFVYANGLDIWNLFN
ncbi:MAG: hypothetical protein CBC73_02270 [Flavobacteriales bacterium TMED113]|nr:MAG: hypothetical protein CBC73_02270 [Flavobacteriales bacterium TMED113]